MMRAASGSLGVLLLLGVSNIALAQQIVTPFIVIPEPTGGPDIQIVSPVTPLPAKERVNFFLSIVNVGPGGIHDPSIFIEPSSGSDLVIIGQAQRDLEDLPQNQSGLLVVRIATPDRAGSGALNVIFTFRDDAGNLRTLTHTVNVQVAPPRSDPLRATYIGGPLEKGNQDNVTLLLENPSDTAITQLDVNIRRQQTTLGLTTGNEDLTPGDEGSIVVQGETILPGASRRVVIPVETSLRSEDLLLFTVSASYTYEGFQRVQSFDFGARVVGSVKVRVLEAREVQVNGGLEIAGTIVNVGTGTAWNPRIAAGEGSGLESVSPKLIENLEPNEAVDFRLPVKRVAEPIDGAPLLSIDYNDEQGVVHPATVPAELARTEPPTPSAAAVAWSRLLSLWRPILVGLAVLLVLGLALRHLALKRHEEREEEIAAARSSQTSRYGRKPGGKRGSGGARPGA